MFKSTIVIWSEFNPALVELSHLAQEAETGNAICTDFQIEPTEDPGADSTFTQEAVEFFQLTDAYPEGF